MKNKFLLLSLVATVFCSCSNDEALVETTPTTNAIETSNTETSRVSSFSGPSQLSRAVNWFPAKFQVNLVGGTQSVRFFLDGVFLSEDSVNGGVAFRSLRPEELAPLTANQNHVLTARQTGTPRSEQKSLTFFLKP